jgi:hypothetical protein
MINNMPPLKPGDFVVPLATLSAQSASVSCALSIAFTLWRVNSPWSGVLLGLVAGAVTGGILGRVIGRSTFPASSGQALVVPAGRAALPFTLRASLISSALAGAALSFAVALLFDAQLLPVVLTALCFATIVGLIFGFGAALL